MRKTIAAGLLAAAALASAGTAQADSTFDICPSGQSGVIGGHTSCAFADIVAGGYYRHGPYFDAYSPATGQWYSVACVSGYMAHFTNGATYLSANCFAGDNARVVVW